MQLAQADKGSLAYWQRRVLVVSWLTYASLYLGRVNLAVALPALQGSLGFSKTEAGLIGGAFFWVYAIGQLLNGLLGDRVDARAFVALGLLASAAINVAFGFTGRLAVMAILWGINGYVQATGWAPMVGLLSRWYPPNKRARVTTLFGPCYNIGNIASWLLAGVLVSRVGWQAAFWVPAGILLLSAGHWWARVRGDPSDVGLPSMPESPSREGQPALWPQLKESFLHLLRHPQLRVVALSCIGMGVIKEGFTFWIPTFLSESAGLDISKAAVYAISMPLAGSIGIVASGWISHRFFRSNELPVIIILMAIVGAIMLAYQPIIALLGFGFTPILLGLIGATVHGSNTLVVTSLPLSYTAQGRVSSVSGFLGFASYVGSVLSGVLTGVLVDHVGWNAAFILWAAAGFTSAGVLVLMLRTKRNPAGSLAATPGG